MNSYSCILFTAAPLWSLKHSATHVGGTPVRAPVPLSEQHKHLEHSLRLPHSALDILCFITFSKCIFMFLYLA